MKAVLNGVLLAALSRPTTSATLQLSPITRVVEILQGLAKTAEKEGKKEEDLYETYVCWAKTVIDAKTASTADAKSKIEELENYIADLDSGRVELTTERVDLEKEIKELVQDMEGMTAQRDKEKEDYEAAKSEMEDGIEGLDQAIEVLKSATEGSKEGTFLQAKAQVTEGFAARAAEAAKLQKAVEISKSFLHEADAMFLQRVLTGEVPKVDWKKLNRKANFKMAYKARSFKIQDVLTKMRDTFNTNLEDATKKEDDALAQYSELFEAKSGQKEEATTALENQDGENGAKAMSKADSEAERDALTTQVTNDERYVQQTIDDLKNKKAEWKDRQELRAGEIEAINKAVSILHSDDARDLMKKSFESQSFLQEKSSTKTASNMRAAEVLRRSAAMSGDKRLASLATRLAAEPMATGTHFDEVIEAIDAMVVTLKEQETQDLENKETCESDRAEDTRSAVKAGRKMDEASDTITKLKNDIVEIEKTIEDNLAEVKAITEELAKATTVRGDEQAQWVQSNEDDTAAAALVMQAKDVLSNFYSENNLNLAQTGVSMDPGAAGDAPPPPPPTWEAPYGGKTESANGIVAIMEMIHADIEKDITKAKTDNEKAQTEFDTFKEDSETQVSTLEEANDDLNGTKGEKEDDITSEKQERIAQKDQMTIAINKIGDATAGCDYITLNYNVRLTNRQNEIDGLTKAKAILQGGEFS